MDTNGIGKDLGLELVVYKTENGEEKFWYTKPFEIVKTDGNIVTYKLNTKLKDAGVFRYSYRLYPVNANLPHRMDFAYTKWF